jgi:diguanylate cyclase
VEYIDTLTGLPGRRELQEVMERTIAAGESFSVALLDLDHFLGINLDFGPEVGDKVLKTLATLTSESAGEAKGSAFRISGDEMAVFLPGMALEQAFLRMEKLRDRVETSVKAFGVPDGRVVTVTIGVAQYPRDGKDAQALMTSADAALAAAKEQGRNLVRLPSNEEMILKSCYYPASDVRKLKVLAEKVSKKESLLLREALSDLLRKHDR